MTGLSDERLAEIRQADAMYNDADLRTGYGRAPVIDHRRELLAAYADLRAENKRLRAQVAEVRVIHVENRSETTPWCDHDGFTWPCLTIRALAAGDEVQR